MLDKHKEAIPLGRKHVSPKTPLGRGMRAFNIHDGIFYSFAYKVYESSHSREANHQVHTSLTKKSTAKSRALDFTVY